jgi:hypothetical protein
VATEASVRCGVRVRVRVRVRVCVPAQLDWLSARVPAEAPHTAKHAAKWDSMTCSDAMNSLLFTSVVKDLMLVAVRALCGVEPADMSFLHFLAYLNSSQGFLRLTTIANGNQVGRAGWLAGCWRCAWGWGGGWGGGGRVVMCVGPTLQCTLVGFAEGCGNPLLLPHHARLPSARLCHPLHIPSSGLHPLGAIQSPGVCVQRWQSAAVSGLLCAPYPMPHAPCPMPHAPCPMVYCVATRVR